MTTSSKKPIIDGDRVFKATNVKIKTLHPIFLGLAQSLSNIVMLRFIKIYNDMGIPAKKASRTAAKAAAVPL